MVSSSDKILGINKLSKSSFNSYFIKSKAYFEYNVSLYISLRLYLNKYLKLFKKVKNKFIYYITFLK